MPFKWNATRIQVMPGSTHAPGNPPPPPSLTASTSLNTQVFTNTGGPPPQAGMPCLVKLPLGGEGGTAIAMAGELAHVEGDHAGVLCRSIDLESITHLRRLIEVNLGDTTASERELQALIAAARGLA